MLGLMMQTALTTQIDALSARIDELLAAMPDAQPIDPHPGGPTPGPSTDTVSDAALGAVDRLDEIPGIGPNVAQGDPSPRSGST